MKILIVGKVPTHPVQMGNSRLITDQATLLKELGHDVHYLYIHEVRRKEKTQDVTPAAFKEMVDFWGEKFHLLRINKLRHLFLITRAALKYRLTNGYIHPDDHYSSSIHREINRLNRKYEFDCCIVNYYYLSKALKYISIPRKALLTHDIFTFRDMVCDYKVRESLTPNHEALAVQRAQFILNVQDEDSIYFKKLAPKSTILTTYTSFKYTPTNYVGTHNILYLSGNSIFNTNGIRWFIDQILPKLSHKIPDVCLMIGGGISNALKEYHNHPNIKLCGYIDDTDSFFNSGDVFINPTYQGTGLKIKTFEGIAHGKVVLSHPHSTIGIYNRANAPLISSDNPEKWAAEIIECFNDPNKILRIKDNCAQYLSDMNTFIEKQYSILLNS